MSAERRFGININGIKKTWRPLVAAATAFGGQAAMTSPSFAEILRQPQPITAEAPKFDLVPAILPPSAINIEKDPAKIDQLTVSMIDQVNRMFPDAETQVNAVGYRISKGWKAQDGFEYLATQRVIFQRDRSGRMFLWNTLSNMSDFGLDEQLDNLSFGVTIPPKQEFRDTATTLDGIFDERTRILGIPQQITRVAQEYREVLEIGVPEGFSAKYRSYRVARYQRIAFMLWMDGPNKGLVQPILAGDAAAAAGLIPKDVLLDKPDLGSGGGLPETPIVTRPFAPKYVAGNSEINNPATGEIGWKETYDGGLALVDEMVKDVGLTGGIKFVETPGLPKISGITRVVRACQDTSDPRCQNEFLRWVVEIKDKTAYVQYDVVSPSIVFKPGELDHSNWGLTLTGAVPDALRQDANSPKWLEWRAKMINAKPIVLAAPIQ